MRSKVAKILKAGEVAAVGTIVKRESNRRGKARETEMRITVMATGLQVKAEERGTILQTTSRTRSSDCDDSRRGSSSSSSSSSSDSGWAVWAKREGSRSSGP